MDSLTDQLVRRFSSLAMNVMAQLPATIQENELALIPPRTFNFESLFGEDRRLDLRDGGNQAY